MIDLEEKTILDAACGGRMFWFEKAHPNVLYVDKRILEPTRVGHGIHQRTRQCLPDEVMDFRKLDLPDDHFSMVVFDPPHLLLGKNSHTAQVYGSLDKENWREDLTKGFAECFRVLKPGGFLIFKWHEFNITVSEILKLTPHKPLFGHKSGKAQMTHWICFMKEDIDTDCPSPKNPCFCKCHIESDKECLDCLCGRHITKKESDERAAQQDI